MRIRALSIIGTRPEVIKLAPVVRAMAQAESFEPLLCATGQHQQMVRQMCDMFSLTPDYQLQVMQPGQALNALTARLVEQLDRMLLQASPDLVLVQGDTTSAFCGAVAAFHRGIPVGHVEAGLRTGDLRQPFPEEANRQMVGRLAQWHFAPTARAGQNLLDERVAAERIHITGNTVIDALQWMTARLQGSEASARISAQLAQQGLELGAAADERLVLVTGHRRESWGEGMEQLCRALRQISTRLPAARVVFPVHLNPQVKEPVHAMLEGAEGITLLPPLDYETFVWLMQRSWLMISDSGGVQEEAPSLDVPVLVTRAATERTEAQEAGTVRVVGADAAAIVAATEELHTQPKVRQQMVQAANPYGDGKAADRILEILRDSAEGLRQ